MDMHSARKRSHRRSTVWLAGVVALALAAVVSPRAFGSVDPESGAAAAGTAAGEAATAGAVRAGNFLGVTFGFPSDTLAGTAYNGGATTIYNLPMFKTDGDEAHFWDSYVEQLQTSGVDFVAPTIRGIIPGKPQYNGGGDTTKLKNLVAAIKRRGANIKISALDDTAYSLTNMKNLDKHAKGGYDPKFDLADVNGTGEGGYKYLWDNNLRQFYLAVPADMRFTMDGRPVVYEWSLADKFFVNQGGGHAAALLSSVKQKAKAEFGVEPYLIVDDTWISKDPAVANVADGVDNWFTMAHSYTLATFKGKTYGALAPAFHVGSGSTVMNIDANHGNAFKAGLDGTVGAGAAVTLVEGFSDWKENCAMWRGRPGAYDVTRYDYPNQMINILRQYSRDPFPTGTRIEAEGADAYSDTTPGNAYQAYRDGDVDVQTATDGGPGWVVGATAAGEWLEWKQIPLSGAVTLKLRLSSAAAGRQVRIDVDGKAGPVTTVPNTGAFTTYQTVNAGAFSLAANSLHTVRVNFLNGGVNLNYWSN